MLVQRPAGQQLIDVVREVVADQRAHAGQQDTDRTAQGRKFNGADLLTDQLGACYSAGLRREIRFFKLAEVLLQFTNYVVAVFTSEELATLREMGADVGECFQLGADQVTLLHLLCYVQQKDMVQLPLPTRCMFVVLFNWLDSRLD